MKKWIILLILLIIILISGFFAFSQQDNTPSQITYGQYINQFINNIKTNNSFAIAGSDVNRRGLVKSFCNNIYQTDLRKGFYYDAAHQFNYNPDDSAFMKILCRNIDYSFGSQSNIPDGVIKMNGLSNWVDGNSKCRWSTTMNGCNMSIRLSELLHQIVGDYATIKVVGLFGNTAPDISKVEEQAKLFSNYYFGICNGQDSIYLNKNTDKSYCNHPNTFNMLNNYIGRVNKNLTATKVIDFSAISKIEGVGPIIKTAFIKDCNIEQNIDKVGCGLNDFNNLVMNELMYYTMFLNFYKTWVPTSQQFDELRMGQGFAGGSDGIKQEAFRTQIELDIARDSIGSTLKTIRNLYTWFPVHVGLVAYLEDLVRFRDELIKLYTPVHQTYYKFRNIQVRE